MKYSREAFQYQSAKDSFTNRDFSKFKSSSESAILKREHVLPLTGKIHWHERENPK